MSSSSAVSRFSHRTPAVGSGLARDAGGGEPRLRHGCPGLQPPGRFLAGDGERRKPHEHGRGACRSRRGAGPWRPATSPEGLAAIWNICMEPLDWIAINNAIRIFRFAPYIYADSPLFRIVMNSRDPTIYKQPPRWLIGSSAGRRRLLPPRRRR